MGNATSSMMTVVPVLRTEPTDGNMPARIFHSNACSAETWVNTAGSTSLRPPTASAASLFELLDAPLPARTETRPAIPPRLRAAFESTTEFPPGSPPSAATRGP